MLNKGAGGRFAVKIPAVVLFMWILTAAAAQERAVLSLSVPVPAVRIMEVIERNPFPVISSRHMADGYIQVERAVVIAVRSNTHWRLTIRSPRRNLYMSPGRFKPVEHFQWKVAGGAFQPVSFSPVPVARGKGGSGTVRVEVDYRMLLNWTDTPPGEWLFEPEYRIEQDEEGFSP